MAIADHNHQSGNNNSNGSTPPTTSSASASASASSALYHHHVQNHAHGSNSVSTRRCPKLDPAAKLYFSHEPGKQARSSLNIKISGKSYIAFKHQKLLHASSRGCTRFRGKYYCNKWKLKEKQLMGCASQFVKALEKLRHPLADADAAVEARKRPPEDAFPKIIGEGLVIDEWKERRERYFARQQVEGLDSI